MCVDMENLVVAGNGCRWIDVGANAAFVIIARGSSRKFGC